MGATIVTTKEVLVRLACIGQYLCADLLSSNKQEQQSRILSRLGDFRRLAEKANADAQLDEQQPNAEDTELRYTGEQVDAMLTDAQAMGAVTALSGARGIVLVKRDNAKRRGEVGLCTEILEGIRKSQAEWQDKVAQLDNSEIPVEGHTHFDEDLLKAPACSCGRHMSAPIPDDDQTTPAPPTCSCGGWGWHRTSGEPIGKHQWHCRYRELGPVGAGMCLRCHTVLGYNGEIMTSAPVCSCGESYYDRERHAWYRQAMGGSVSDRQFLVFATACPVCGDLLRVGGEVVRMVELDVAAEIAGGAQGMLDESPARGRWEEMHKAAKEPVGFLKEPVIPLEKGFIKEPITDIAKPTELEKGADSK